jgi:hypothetical protein
MRRLRGEKLEEIGRQPTADLTFSHAAHLYVLIMMMTGDHVTGAYLF